MSKAERRCLARLWQAAGEAPCEWKAVYESPGFGQPFAFYEVCRYCGGRKP